MYDLPYPVLEKVLDHLSITDIENVSKVCKLLSFVCHWYSKRRRTLFLTYTLNNPSDDTKFYLSLFRKCHSSDVQFGKALLLFKTMFTNIGTLVLHYCTDLKEDNLYLVGKYLPHLRNLWIETRSLTDFALINLLIHCNRLETLILGGEDYVLSSFTFHFLPPLKTLITPPFALKDSHMEALRSRVSHSLRTFGFYLFENVTNNFFDIFENLESLKINCVDIRDSQAIIVFISALKRIRELFLFSCPELIAGKVSSLPKFTSLKSLYFDSRIHSDAAFAEFITKFPNIETLQFHVHYFGSETVDIRKSVEAINSLELLQVLTIDCNRNMCVMQSLFNNPKLRKLYFHTRSISLHCFTEILKQFERTGALLEVNVIEEYTDRDSCANVAEEETRLVLASKSNVKIDYRRYYESCWPFIEAPLYSTMF